jgi:orotidine-5'-phosphate decarboxylase
MSRPTQLISVLDVDTRDEALAVVEACGDAVGWFKVGAQLFTRCGPGVVREIQNLGKGVMLDLKYHDIPNTVAKAALAAAHLDVELFTVHASGGRAMLEAAREAIEGHPARMLAVTVLTSFSDNTLRADLNVQETAAEAVARLAKMAVEAGAHGLVCSPQEIGLVREAVGPEPLVVTPGIRPAWASTDDQARVMTPAQAAEAGADYIVVGRPILNAPDPADAARRVLKELAP